MRGGSHRFLEGLQSKRRSRWMASNQTAAVINSARKFITSLSDWERGSERTRRQACPTQIDLYIFLNSQTLQCFGVIGNVCYTTQPSLKCNFLNRIRILLGQPLSTKKRISRLNRNAEKRSCIEMLIYNRIVKVMKEVSNYFVQSK